MKKRLEFSNSQKAEIYARDKAVCGFSGKILWILYYGASYAWDTDWVDHIKPAMRGGDNRVENGICASSFYNSKKKDNSHDNKFLFIDGKPTIHFFYIYGFLPKELTEHLKRFEKIHFSDWYLNRAYQNLMICIDHEINPFDLKGNKIKRDLGYWAGAAFKKLLEWKKIALKEQVEDFRSRLYEKNYKFSEDQKIMLKLIDCNNIDEVKELVYELLPYYKNSIEYFKELVNVKENKNIKEFESRVKNEKFLSERDKEIFLEAINF